MIKLTEVFCHGTNRETYMKYLHNIFVCFVLYAPYNVFASDEFSSNINLTFAVNIEPPVCKLNSAEQSIDFGDLSVQDITGGNTTKSATFSFTGCTSVESLTISFTGDNVDENGNYIKNKTGTDYASGIGIKLYDKDHNEITLKGDYSQSVGKGATSFDLLIYASIEKENSNSSIQAGLVDSSVSFSITYN
ncbi:TPA: type 1 fimbrial protein [Escherichia coli]|nr:type 1 fimbrial protein [Escherichia coli]